MGLFSKKKIATEESKENSKIVFGWHELPIYGADEVVSVYNIKQISHAQHRDGRKCNVYAARVLKHGKNHAIMPDLGDYVCFEITPELEKEILSTIEKRDGFLNNIAAYYLYRLVDREENDRFYLGEMGQQDNKNEYKVINSSDTVKKFFEDYVDKELAQREEKYNHYREEKEKNEFIQRLKIEENANKRHEEYLKYQNEIKQRADNPYIRLVHMRRGSNQKVYSDYDCINVSEGEEKGKILRIRDLEKIGKDGSGTYLYSAYLCNVNEEYDVELFDRSTSAAVCFELYRRIEDIINDGDKQEIYSVLNFLSNPNNYKNFEELNYIGHLDRETEIQPNGEIKRTIVEKRENESDSPAIAAQIRRMQQQFSRGKGQSR